MKSELKYKLRQGVPVLTARLAKLPVDERGCPIPFFISWHKGGPFRESLLPKSVRKCLGHNLCWICGEKLGRFKTFVLKPSQAVMQACVEPPSHTECAEWFAQGCPFTQKRPGDLADAGIPAKGLVTKYVPGVICLWSTNKFYLCSNDKGGLLIEVDDPVTTAWWHEGRLATRLEVVDAIDNSIPPLLEMCKTPKERATVVSAWRLLESGRFIPDEPERQPEP